jgi:hypothetical protein
VNRTETAVHIEPEVFLRFDPSTAAVPVVVDVSRSGRFYPIDFRSPVPFTALHDNERGLRCGPERGTHGAAGRDAACARTPEVIL